MEFCEDPKFFLGMNTRVLPESEGDKLEISCEAYSEQMADKYVPDWRARQPVPLPATEKMVKAYDKAHLRECTPSAEMLKSYGGKVGAMIYTSPCVRGDARGRRGAGAAWACRVRVQGACWFVLVERG